jgi:hypothetical protein
MSELGSELLKRYGVVAIIAAAILAAIVAASVWGLAHFASAPGTPVKVLWGLVEYTKTPVSSSETTNGVNNKRGQRAIFANIKKYCSLTLFSEWLQGMTSSKRLFRQTCK